MKHLIITLFLCLFCFSAFAGKRDPGGGNYTPTPSKCNETKTGAFFGGFQMYGDQLLNFYRWYSFDEALNAGCTITITTKSNGSCTYTSSQTYTSQNRADVYGSTIYNVKIPAIPTNGWSITVKIESPCVYDYYMGMNVKFTWMKTIAKVNTNANLSNFDMGFGSKSVCPNNTSSPPSGGSRNFSANVREYLNVCLTNDLIQY
jgi:hypothetical protein